MPRPPHRTALLRLLHTGAPARDAVPPDGVDWDAFLAYTSVSLAPLVLHGIGSRTGIVPPAVMRTLAERRSMMERKRLVVASTLRSASAALDAASVPFLVLKGAALASLVYPDPVLRPMSDIDLWIPREGVPAALDALAATGFRDSEQSELQAPAARQTDEWRLVRTGAPLQIELHTRLESLDGVPWADFDSAWAAGRDADLGGVRARVPCPEHMLVHVCLHLARRNHFTTGISHLLDVARIVSAWPDDWDWPRMVRDWRGQGVAVWMLLALVLARDLLGAAVPADIEAPAGDDEWRSMLAIAEEQLWEGRARQLPSAVRRTARFASPGQFVRWLRWRAFDHYWRSPESRPATRVLAEGLRRIGHDLTVKVPTYLRGWVRGQLRGRTLAEGRALERDRAELERLVAQRDAASRPGVATRPPER